MLTKSESLSYYSPLSIIYSLTNWIPLRCVKDGEVWDCLDVNTSIVVRFLVISPEDEEGNEIQIKYLNQAEHVLIV
jgi:hypothetical protein